MNRKEKSKSTSKSTFYNKITDHTTKQGNQYTKTGKSKTSAEKQYPILQVAYNHYNTVNIEVIEQSANL